MFRIAKNTFATFIIGILFLFSAQSAFAFPRELFTTFAFSVRELHGDQPTLALPRLISQAASVSATPISWYLNYDALNTPSTAAFFNTLLTQPRQEIAVLLEVTPGLLSDTAISSGSVPATLNSYLPADRTKLIDTVFNKYLSQFGHYPKTVYFPNLDSFSLSYIHDHYSVTAAITDPREGIFPFFSYYPSTQNAYVPAQDAEHRIKLVINTLNPPDLWGAQITASNIDQTLRDFALKDLNQSVRLIIGTENSASPEQYLSQFKSISSALAQEQIPLSIHQATASEFGTFFAQYYPLTSPAYHYRASSGDRAVLYYQNPFYQLKLEQAGDQTLLTHLTVFNQSQTEEFRNQRNLSNYFRPFTLPIVTDSNPIPLEIDLNGTYTTTDWRLFLTDGDKSLKFLPQQLETKNLDLKLPQSPQVNGLSFDSSYLPFRTPAPVFIINLLKLLALGLVVFLIIRSFGFDLKLKINNLSLGVILLGSIAWLITTVFSGSHTIYGLSFWGPQGHDAFVHLSLIESFRHSLWPLNNPTLINSTVINYHILFDLLIALLSKFLDIPALDLYFRYLPPVLAVSIGLLSARLMDKWNFSRMGTAISLSLIYAAGSLGFLAGGGESVFWANQAASTLLNPPFALSLVILLIWINLFTEKLSLKKILFLSILGGLLIQTKSYSAVLLIAGLGLSILKSFFSRKLGVHLFVLFILLGVFTILFWLPTFAPGRSVFIFSPLWFTRSLVSSPDRLPWPAAANALVNYPLNGQLLKFVLLELVVTVVFFVGNLGVRLFALPQLLKKDQSLSQQIVTNIVIFGCILPLFLIQTANPWNTIQFFYYSLFFTGLLSGPAIVRLLYSMRKLPLFLITLALLTILSFTTTTTTLRDYISPTPAAFIGYAELNTLSTLARQPRGIVISPEYSLNQSRPYAEPKPIFAYITTSYISALTGQPSYIADDINLAISNYSYAEQSQNQQRFYRTADASYLSDFLQQNQIKYVYQNPQFQLKTSTTGLTPIFDSGYFTLYTITK